MCFRFFHYTVDQEHLTQGIAVENDGLELKEGNKRGKGWPTWRHPRQ